MAEAIETTRRRIAECERRIARLEAIGASTWAPKEFLASLYETLAVQRYLHQLTRSYMELASSKHAELRTRTGIELSFGARADGGRRPPDAARDAASRSPRRS
jgi:hypothetical protein